MIARNFELLTPGTSHSSTVNIVQNTENKRGKWGNLKCEYRDMFCTDDYDHAGNNKYKQNISSRNLKGKGTLRDTGVEWSQDMVHGGLL
jgi:hypothetical protein